MAFGAFAVSLSGAEPGDKIPEFSHESWAFFGVSPLFSRESSGLFSRALLGLYEKSRREAILSPTQCDGRAFVCRPPRLPPAVPGWGAAPSPPALHGLCRLLGKKGGGVDKCAFRLQ